MFFPFLAGHHTRICNEIILCPQVCSQPAHVLVMSVVCMWACITLTKGNSVLDMNVVGRQQADFVSDAHLWELLHLRYKIGLRLWLT